MFVMCVCVCVCVCVSVSNVGMSVGFCYHPYRPCYVVLHIWACLGHPYRVFIYENLNAVVAK